MAGVQRNDRVGPVGEQNGRAFFRPAFRQPRIAAGQIVGAVEIEAVRLRSGVAEKADSGFRVELLPEADRQPAFAALPVARYGETDRGAVAELFEQLRLGIEFGGVRSQVAPETENPG